VVVINNVKISEGGKKLQRNNRAEKGAPPLPSVSPVQLSIFFFIFQKKSQKQNSWWWQVIVLATIVSPSSFHWC
jgi:hypothetical protein